MSSTYPDTESSQAPVGLRHEPHIDLGDPSESSESSEPITETLHATRLVDYLVPISLHCCLCYLQSSFGEVTYSVVGDVPTVLAMQSGLTVILAPLMGLVPIFQGFYPANFEFRLPSRYLAMLLIPNTAFAFQLLFKQLAIQRAGVGFGEIISGFSVLLASWLQYIVLGIRLDDIWMFMALGLYALSLFCAWFKVGFIGMGIGLVQGSCSSVRTIYTRKVNEKIIIKPGHHQFFTGLMNLMVMGTLSIYFHTYHTFIDEVTGEQFYPIHRIFWSCSIKQFLAAFSDNILVFYLMSILAPLSYHLQGQVESLLSTTLDFAGVTEMLGGHHKTFLNWPTVGAYGFRLWGVALYSYAKLNQHLKAQREVQLRQEENDSTGADEVLEKLDMSDCVAICDDAVHGLYISLEQRCTDATPRPNVSILFTGTPAQTLGSHFASINPASFDQSFRTSQPFPCSMRSSSSLATPMLRSANRFGSETKPDRSSMQDTVGFGHQDVTPGGFRCRTGSAFIHNDYLNKYDLSNMRTPSMSSLTVTTPDKRGSLRETRIHSNWSLRSGEPRHLMTSEDRPKDGIDYKVNELI